MRVVEVRAEDGFDALRESWNRLLRESASNTVFLTWEWARAWWRAYGRAGDLRILLAVEDGGAIRGIAPLRQATIQQFRRRYPALALIGDGSADSDYLDFIAAAGEERKVLAAFASHLESEIAAGTLLQLNEIPDTSPNLAILREMGTQKGMVYAEAESPCGTVRLPADWASYLKTLAPRFRTKIRSVLRNVEARDDIRFYFCESLGEAQRLLPALFELHGKRWAKESKPGVFRGEDKRAFYNALSAELVERGWLTFSALEWRGRVLACQYGFTYENCYSQLQEGYEPDCEHWNVGVALRAWSIQQLLARGVSEYDFLGGVGRHKSDWGAQTKLSRRIIFGRGTAANALLCRGPQWVVETRQFFKKQVPKKWLAARDARQEQQRIARYRGQSTGSTRSTGTRHALAALYHSLPFSMLLRPVRQRYRLRFSGSGRGPALRLEKRQHPSVRILYYHRINDDCDPFFPSTPLAQFERELAFVSRNYRVVSMAEALRRLSEGGPAEPVVAITFDDGYEDNSRVAYPVLKRYGIPATIFLTTGGLDLREPLWFERLALGLKKSARNAVDLELDLPRRFSLATVRDRLRANDEIYGFLRALPDASRRDWLEEILKQLEASDSGERRDKMLTWEQVRWLSKNGIDFGGHTVTHPFVSKLDRERASWEAVECKRRIEEEVQRPVEFFAYPSGREMDFADWNKELLQRAGYRAAVSTIWGVNDPSTDRMELRRGQPWETSASEFAAKLDWYQWLDA